MSLKSKLVLVRSSQKSLRIMWAFVSQAHILKIINQFILVSLVLS